MLKSGLARQLIENIPSYMGGMGILPSKGDHKVVVELIPVQGHLVNYNDDEWDFSDAFRYQKRSQLKVNFKNANPEYKTMLKDYAAQQLDSYKCKVSTLCGIVSKITSIMNYAMENSRHGLFILLNTYDIANAINAKVIHKQDRRAAYSCIMYFIEFIREQHGVILPVNLDEMGKMLVRLRDSNGYYMKRNHHKNIPEEYYDAIIKTTNRVMRDETQPFNIRMMAGMILMDSQLGLRSLEVIALEKNCIFEYECSDGIARKYCIYNAIKPAKATTEVIKVKTICTPLLYETWKYMCELRKECRYHNTTDFMFILNDEREDKPGERKFPVSQGSFIYMYKIFFGRYLKEYASKEWKGIEKVRVPNDRNNTIASIPTIHNFRVHFATSLYLQGFPLDFIECIMSHTPQSNTYDAYYDLKTEEFNKAQIKKYKDKESKFDDPEDEFDAFLDELEDD